MVSRVNAYCDFCGEQVEGPSEDQPVILIGYRSYADRGDYHRADVCKNCLATRDVAGEMFALEAADRAKSEPGQIPGSLSFAELRR